MCLNSTFFRYSARSPHRATKPSRGWLRVGGRKPRFVVSNADPTRNKVTAKERTGVLGFKRGWFLGFALWFRLLCVWVGCGGTGRRIHSGTGRVDPDPYAGVLRLPAATSPHNGALGVGPPADAIPATAPTHKVASRGRRNRARDPQPDGHYGAECHATSCLDTGPRGTTSASFSSHNPRRRGPSECSAQGTRGSTSGRSRV